MTGKSALLLVRKTAWIGAGYHQEARRRHRPGPLRPSWRGYGIPPQRSGYRVTGFSDPASALKEFRVHPGDFDIVVTDRSMPRMSGFALTEEIHRIRKEIPVVLTSGYLQTKDQNKAESMGIRELIQKPAPASLLAGALERILGNP